MTQCNSTDNDVLSNIFLINNKKCIVKVLKNELTWSKSGKVEHIVPLKEVLCVKTGELNSVTCCKSSKNTEGSFSSLASLVSDPLKLLLEVHYGQRYGKHKWRVKVLKLSCEDSTVIQLWLNHLNSALHKLKCRPKTLMVFINPFGGEGSGEKIYYNKVKPLFDIAKIKTEDIVTIRAMHARDYLLDCPLSGYDGIISVGGDGMFSEILNGFLCRTHKNNDDISQDINIRLGYIPAGSTDAIANGTHGTVDVITSVLHIIFGDSLAIDVCSIYHNENFIKYTAMFHGYGYFGDTLKRSERLRWLGPHRYDLAGVIQFLNNTYYEGKIKMCSIPEIKNAPLQYKVRCTSDCDICDKSMSKTKDEETVWTEIEGKFLSVTGLNHPCLCRHAKQGLSPSAHLGDGNLDLVLVHKTSRFNNLRYLFRSAVYPGSQFKLPFVEVHRVKEFTFIPCSVGKSSAWNCDGELISEPWLTVKNNQQFIKVFARGIEEFKTAPCYV